MKNHFPRLNSKSQLYKWAKQVDGETGDRNSKLKKLRDFVLEKFKNGRMQEWN